VNHFGRALANRFDLIFARVSIACGFGKLVIKELPIGTMKHFKVIATFCKLAGYNVAIIKNNSSYSFDYSNSLC